MTNIYFTVYTFMFALSITFEKFMRKKITFKTKSNELNSHFQQLCDICRIYHTKSTCTLINIRLYPEQNPPFIPSSFQNSKKYKKRNSTIFTILSPLWIWQIIQPYLKLHCGGFLFFCNKKKRACLSLLWKTGTPYFDLFILFCY